MFKKINAITKVLHITKYIFTYFWWTIDFFPTQFHDLFLNLYPCNRNFLLRSNEESHSLMFYANWEDRSSICSNIILSRCNLSLCDLCIDFHIKITFEGDKSLDRKEGRKEINFPVDRPTNHTPIIFGSILIGQSSSCYVPHWLRTVSLSIIPREMLIYR